MNDTPAETADPAIDRVTVRVLPDGRLDRRNSAKYIGVAEKTMAMWQTCGKGPRSVKVGGRRYSYKSDLDAYIRGEKPSE